MRARGGKGFEFFFHDLIVCLLSVLFCRPFSHASAFSSPPPLPPDMLLLQAKCHVKSCKVFVRKGSA